MRKFPKKVLTFMEKHGLKYSGRHSLVHNLAWYPELAEAYMGASNLPCGDPPLFAYGSSYLLVLSGEGVGDVSMTYYKVLGDNAPEVLDSVTFKCEASAFDLKTALITVCKG